MANFDGPMRTGRAVMPTGRRQFLVRSAALLGAWTLSRQLGAQDKSDVSGEYYDWQKTMKPETPWLHDYSQTYIYGLFLCQRKGNGQVKRAYLTFQEALEAIRKYDKLTLGVPKIVVIVGWQYNGHDSNYPSWAKVNEHLKRPQDKTALESLKWLMGAAKEYNTTVTLHINMFDAYKESPLWKAYDEANIIIKDANGVPIPGPHYDGMQSYQISYAQEWKLGYAQKRIDALLQMLPELKESGVIHIDAFKTIQGVRPAAKISSPLLGFTIEDEIAAQRKMLRYWRLNGVDVTTEYASNTIDPDPFIGLQVGNNCTDGNQMLYYDWYRKPDHFLGLPPDLFSAGPCVLEEPKGDPGKVHYEYVAMTFCKYFLPWYYHNNRAPKDDGWAFLPNYFGDIFLPAPWRPGTIIAYSESGTFDIAKLPRNVIFARAWRLPKSWDGVSTVQVSRITVDGLKALYQLPVKDGTINLRLKARDYVAIEKT